MRWPLGEEHVAVAFDHSADDGYGKGGGHVAWFNKELSGGATFLRSVCFSAMKTFIKVLLVALLVIVAIKLCPLILLAALVTLLGALLLGTLGLSALAGVLLVALLVAVVLSPLWVPVLLVVGIVALWRKSRRPVVMSA